MLDCKKMQTLLDINIVLEDELCFSFDFIEAELIAYLSGRVLNNLPTTLPSITGVKKPTISGEIYQ